VHRPERTAAVMAAAALADRWEDGWQPLDITHVVHRRLGPAAMRLAVDLLAAALATLAPGEQLPTRWRGQLELLQRWPLRAPEDAAVDEVVLRWRIAERIDVGEGLEVALGVLALLSTLPRLEPLEPVPSQWGRPGVLAGLGPPVAGEPKLYATVRALLAKAESTSFPAEAEAFTAKAQDLMSRHALDAAMLAAGGDGDGDGAARTGEVRPRRVPIDHPYGTEKAQLLGAVAAVNGVQVVWDDELGLATIVGFPIDLDLVELVFASLLVQATRAVAAAGASPSGRRAPSFRRAFLLSFADRVGERLDAAAARATRQGAEQYGAALVPVLARRDGVVRAVTEQLFPGTRPMRQRLVDAEGWDAGRRAADRADLGAAGEARRARGRPRSRLEPGSG